MEPRLQSRSADGGCGGVSTSGDCASAAQGPPNHSDPGRKPEGASHRAAAWLDGQPAVRRSRIHGSSVGEPPPGVGASPSVLHGRPAIARGSRRSASNRRQLHFMCALLLPAMVVAMLSPSAAAGQSAVDAPTTGATNGSASVNSTNAYQTSDDDELLPALRTYFPPGTFFGNGSFPLGVTRYRHVNAEALPQGIVMLPPPCLWSLQDAARLYLGCKPSYHLPRRFYVFWLTWELTLPMQDCGPRHPAECQCLRHR